jgi:hypothetical protein
MKLTANRLTAAAAAGGYARRRPRERIGVALRASVDNGTNNLSEMKLSDCQRFNAAKRPVGPVGRLACFCSAV